MAVQRKIKLTKDSDLNAKNAEDIFEEIAKEIPTEDDYRVIRTQKKTVGAAIPTGLRHGEIIADEEASVLAIRLGKKMYKIADLTEL